MERLQTDSDGNEKPQRAEQYEGISILYDRIYSERGVAEAEGFIWMLADALGGERVRIPSLEVLHREGRNRCICSDYDTGRYSCAELSAKYDLDARHISRILKKEQLFGKEG